MATPLDFLVDEVPSYLPCGAGEHLMVRIEKSGITSAEAMRRIAKAAGLPEGAVSAAGHKDKAARARQWISLPVPIRAPLPELKSAESEELKVLEAARHGNKLRPGHQRGNRFTITIRELPEGGLERAALILARLRSTGVPNGFGPQRFGREGDNAERALACVRGTAHWPRDRRLRSLFMSALQSKVFNRLLELRLETGTFGAALLGDVMQKHATGGLFDVEDAATETLRVQALEISPTGLLPGPRARRAQHEAKALEDRAMAEVGIGESELAALDDGTRRAMRYPLDPEAKLGPGPGPSTMVLEVFLPSGAYATVLLGELMKPEQGEVLRALPES